MAMASQCVIVEGENIELSEFRSSVSSDFSEISSKSGSENIESENLGSEDLTSDNPETENLGFGNSGSKSLGPKRPVSENVESGQFGSESNLSTFQEHVDDTESTNCLRCGVEIEKNEGERVGPIRGRVFHKTCFTCAQCQHQLSMRTYFTNQVDLEDREVYCLGHVPRLTNHCFDNKFQGFRSSSFRNLKNDSAELTGPQIGIDCLHISNPLETQRFYSEKYQQSNRGHQYSGLPLNKIIQADVEVHNSCSDEMTPTSSDSAESRYLYDSESEAKFEADTLPIRGQTVKLDIEGEGHPDEGVNNLEYESGSLDSGTCSSLLFEEERSPGEARIEKDQEPIKVENGEASKPKQGASCEDPQNIEPLADKNEIEYSNEEASITLETLDDVTVYASDDVTIYVPDDVTVYIAEEVDDDVTGHMTHDVTPRPPNCRKRDLYVNVKQFQELDEHAANITVSDIESIESLVRELVKPCTTELETVRVLFRWLTLQDLNFLPFAHHSTSQRTDTLVYNRDSKPLDLLFEISSGNFTYHRLFSLLCSCAGVACMEIKGRSKTNGFSPGDRITDNRFINTWNVVKIEENWWPVQCNWASRHSIHMKDYNPPTSPYPTSPLLNYLYNDHYFLTDPDEFIYEFLPHDSRWQLLENPISTEQFENKPLVRSNFFQFALELESAESCQLQADECGKVDVKILIPEDFSDGMVIKYRLQFDDDFGSSHHKGESLNRYVYHTRVGPRADFQVHLPKKGYYILEIFTGYLEEEVLNRDISACVDVQSTIVFRLVCDQLTTRSKALPCDDAAEWGVNRLGRFLKMNLLEPSNQNGCIDITESLNIKFRAPVENEYRCRLYSDNSDMLCDMKLNSEGLFSADISPPEPGQYCLDISLISNQRSTGSLLRNPLQLMLAKYLINYDISNVKMPVATLPSNIDEQKDQVPYWWGASEKFNDMGLVATSHPNWSIEVKNKTLCIVFEVFNSVTHLDYNLIQEPDACCNYLVTKTTKRSGKVEFQMRFEEKGTYHFKLYAEYENSESKNKSDNNVFNYLILVTDEKKGARFSRLVSRTRSRFSKLW